MKTLALIMLVLSFNAIAGDAKEQILSRADKLIKMIDTSIELLEEDKMKKACSKVKEIYSLYPDHVKAIGTHMDIFNQRVINLKNEGFANLAYLKSLIKQCQESCPDARPVIEKLNAMKKNLIGQKKVINKLSTDYQNDFYFEFDL